MCRQPFQITGECPLVHPAHAAAAAAGAPDSFFSSGMSQMSASVVSSSDAIDAAFWSAERTTFAGSMTPACTRFSYFSV